MNLKERAKKLKKDIPAVYLSLRDKDTPAAAKAMAALTAAYALSPVDLIPDWIPVLGYLDDVLLLPGMIALTIRLIPAEVWKRNQENAEGMWEGGKPKKWYYAFPVILVWMIVLIAVLKSFVK